MLWLWVSCGPDSACCRSSQRYFHKRLVHKALAEVDAVQEREVWRREAPLVTSGVPERAVGT